MKEFMEMNKKKKNLTNQRKEQNLMKSFKNMLGDSRKSLLLLIHFGDAFFFLLCSWKNTFVFVFISFFCYHLPPVTDSERAVCVDPGENGAILDARGGGGPGPPGGGKIGQLASDSGGG